MGSVNTHAQAVGGPRGQRGVSWIDRQRLAWKTAPIFDFISEPSLKQRHIVGSWLCVLCLVCLCLCVCEMKGGVGVGVGGSMTACACVSLCVCVWVLSTHLLVYSGPLFVSILLAGLPVWETLCLKRPTEGFKDTVGWGERKWWIFRAHWNENPRSPWRPD